MSICGLFSRRRLPAIVAAVLVLGYCHCLEAQAPIRWFPIVRTSGGVECFVDLKTIKKVKNTVTVWIKYVDSDPLSKGKRVEYLNRAEYNGDANVYRNLKLIAYNEADRATDIPQNTKWQTPLPGSIAEGFMEKLSDIYKIAEMPPFEFLRKGDGAHNVQSTPVYSDGWTWKNESLAIKNASEVEKKGKYSFVALYWDTDSKGEMFHFMGYYVFDSVSKSIDCMVEYEFDRGEHVCDYWAGKHSVHIRHKTLRGTYTLSPLLPVVEEYIKSSGAEKLGKR